MSDYINGFLGIFWLCSGVYVSYKLARVLIGEEYFRQLSGPWKYIRDDIIREYMIKYPDLYEREVWEELYFRVWEHYRYLWNMDWQTFSARVNFKQLFTAHLESSLEFQKKVVKNYPQGFVEQFPSQQIFIQSKLWNSLLDQAFVWYNTFLYYEFYIAMVYVVLFIWWVLTVIRWFQKLKES